MHQSIAEKKVFAEIHRFLKESLDKDIYEDSIVIDYPPNISMGNFSVACFSIAKKTGKNPAQVSLELSKKFSDKKNSFELICDAKGFGPYLNFFVDFKKFSEVVMDQILKEKEKFGNAKIGAKEKIMVEYSQPNTHKEFHVGHLRNVSIGYCIVELYRALGYKVVPVNYIGDVGAHVAKCLWAYLKFHKDETAPENKGKYLGNIYVEANKKLEENPEYKKEVSELLQKLESSDKKLLALWKKTRKWSLDEFYAIYKRLGADFDMYFFESEVEKDGKKMVLELLKKGIAQKSEGAVIIDLENFGLKQFLLLKSDGTSLYSTKDLALAQLKFKKYKIDKSFYVVDSRQSFYFKQLFKTLQIMGFKKEMVHIPYEFVTLKEGAMSSRSGNVVLYEDFEEAVIHKIYQETKKRHSDWKEKELMETSRSLAYGAMKYGMLSIGNGSLITFDMERSLEFTGNTGPYLQYTYARIASILRKSATKNFLRGKINHLNEMEEKSIIFHLSKFPKIIEKSSSHFDPSILSNYLFELAQLFSAFYEKVSVLKAQEDIRRERLCLLSSVKITLAKGFVLLGITPLEKM